MGKHIFISYARADGEDFAKKLHELFEARGLSAWMDTRGGIAPSTLWDNEIQKAIDEASILVFVMTPGSIASENCHDEWSYALNLGKTVIPLLALKAQPIPMRLHRIQYIDFTKLSFEIGFDALLKRIKDEPTHARFVMDEIDERVHIFISYKHRDEDEQILEELKGYMEHDVRQAGGVFWYDKGIDWGANWHSEIKQHVERADIALLFISQEYLSSGYVNQQEIPDFLSKRRTEGLLILPLILSHCRWNSRDWLRETQSFPTDRDLRTVRAFREAHREDELYLTITEQLIKHVEAVKQKKIEKRRATLDATTSEFRILQHASERLNALPEHFPRWIPIPHCRAIIGDDSLPKSPQHEVEVEAFLIAETPVTQQQYQRFLLLNPKYRVPNDAEFFPYYSWSETDRTPPDDKLDHPVVLISALDAEAYCSWLTNELRHDLKQLPGAWKVQLPSEVEWELAARGTDHRPYPWGYGAPTSDLSNFDGYFRGTTPVDKFTNGKSPFGVLDMIGNVWEWTRSALRDYPYYTSDGRTSPSGDSLRVLRGGSWQPDTNAQTLRPAYRYGERSEFTYDTIGFRVVISNHIYISGN